MYFSVWLSYIEICLSHMVFIHEMACGYHALRWSNIIRCARSSPLHHGMGNNDFSSSVNSQ